MSEEKVAVSPLDSMPKETQERVRAVLSTTCKKHEKIWGLHSLSVAKKDIATLLGTNQGHVGNAIREYLTKREKIDACVAFFGGVIPTIELPAQEKTEETVVVAEVEPSKTEEPSGPIVDTGVDTDSAPIAE